ncbi:MAG: xylulokinase [Phycisphaerales bacterium]|jgi:xylulokinase
MTDSPPPTPLVLGIDVGTSAVKVLLVEPDGTIAARCSKPYPLMTPQPGWSEQRPTDWWAGSFAAIQEILRTSGVDPSRIKAIGLTGQMHGMVPLDAAGEVIRPAMLWNDQRSQAQCDEIHERLGRSEVIRITGKPMLPSFTAPKVLWMKQHEPEAFARLATVLLPKDYLRYRLSGTLASDVADSSGTSYFDVSTRTWSPVLLDAVGLTLQQVPSLAESCEVSSSVSAHAATETGLVEGTPIVAGAGDQAAEGIGSGVVLPGAVSVAVGTSGVAFAATGTNAAAPDGSIHTYCSAVPRGHHVMGVMLAAGGSFTWLRNALYPDLPDIPESFTEVIDRASWIKPGANGLIFLPYLTGERCPHPDPNARGCFIGLTPQHNRDHMARAVLEGITLGLRDLIELIPPPEGSTPDGPIGPIRVTGGLTRSKVFRQLCADVWGCTVTCPAVVEGAAFGAAILAMAGAGLHESVEQAAGEIVRDVSSTEPGPARGAYDEIHRRYTALYPALKGHFSTGSV